MANEFATKPWNHRAVFNTTAGAATDLIAGGIATQALVIANEDATNSIRVRFDGQDATASVGLLVPAGRTLSFTNGEVPAGKVSAYGASAVPVSIHYIQ